MNFSRHIATKHFQVIRFLLDDIRLQMTRDLGLLSDNVYCQEAVVASNSTLEALRLLKDYAEPDIRPHFVRHLSSIIDDVIWAVSSIQHHVDRDYYSLEYLIQEILMSVNELRDNLKIGVHRHYINSITHDIDVRLSTETVLELQSLKNKITVPGRRNKISVNLLASVITDLISENEAHFTVDDWNELNTLVSHKLGDRDA